MYANGHTFVLVSHTKKACHSLSVCVCMRCLYIVFRNIHMCVHIWRLEEDIGYPVISPLVLFLRWDLSESGASLSACSSCFCLPKHQDCKHTWPHLTAYIGAGNLNSSPHGSAALLPTEPFLQPHKIHVMVFFILFLCLSMEANVKSLLWVIFRKLLGDHLNKSQELQATNLLQDLRMLKYQCPCDSSSP